MEHLADKNATALNGRFKGNLSPFEALWPSAYMPCHDHCQSCQWHETDIVSQIQMKNQKSWIWRDSENEFNWKDKSQMSL